MPRHWIALLLTLAPATACRPAQRRAYPKTEPAPSADSAVAALPPGQAMYETLCATCHGGSGGGQPGAVPPLAGSAYVTGDASTLVAIVLHGLDGPITVAGETYNALMQAWADSLSDPQLAGVATYVRTSWGNNAGAVTPAAVARTRAANASRHYPWTIAELTRMIGNAR